MIGKVIHPRTSQLTAAMLQVSTVDFVESSAILKVPDAEEFAVKIILEKSR